MKKAANFHETIIKFRDKHVPEKSVRMSTFDKDWMSPDLKCVYVEMTKDFVKNRKSRRWKQL